MLRACVAVLGLASLAACSDQKVAAELRSLSGSEDAVFLCRDDTGAGHPYSDCPDRDATNDEKPGGRLSVIALVSQTVTDEVALVNVSKGRVVDVDPSTPGYGFLRVGGRPVSMAATPGGAAAFVATADVGRNGIFALPTTCLDAPRTGKPQLDLTTWPACRLSEAPGEMTVLVETGTEPVSERPGCAPFSPNAGAPEGAAADRACPADVLHEGGAKGRRKLVVALPESGRLAVFDAQALLDISPGTYPACESLIEFTLPLQVNVPAGVAQRLPADLQASACTDAPTPVAPKPARQAPLPGGFAAADTRLYVADQAAPVVHVLDTSRVCGMVELPSLLPLSLSEPERVVTTRRVAVSPLLPSGKRFVYAIDAEDQPGASVMVFDVSDDATDPTPLVRVGSPELSGEKPDRLALGSSARDVTFAYRDIPFVDSRTGVAEFGTRCDPDPAIDPSLPGALARPSSDLLTGARPGLLRGLFGFILLTNGSIAVVDVDDLDAACRRPVEANLDSKPDFRGCAPDSIAGGLFRDGYSENGASFVTGEISCRVVSPHRFRSARLAANNAAAGVRAPSLRGFPQLTLPAAASDTAVADRPRLLAVPFVTPSGQAVPAQVFVGSTRYGTSAESGDLLPTDPNSRGSDLLQALNAVVLPPLEPRSYAAEDTVTLTYEGSYAGEHMAGFLDVDSASGLGVFSDRSRSFCSAGVYDLAAMGDYAQKELGLSAKEASAFAEQHADYVQLRTDFPSADDAYWRGAPAYDRAACLSLFGPADAETLSPERDFLVQQAFSDRLLLAPRAAGVSKLTSAEKIRAAASCFPTAQKYQLRVRKQWALLHSSVGFRHDVVASGVEQACVRSCDPLKKWAKGRVFEISSRAPSCRPAGAEGEPFDSRVGCAEADEVACVYDQAPPGQSAAVTVGGPASECIFNGLNDRFALYRGRTPSVRDAVFTWQTTGGFSPLLMSLTSVSTVALPQSIQFLQQPEQLAVVDGASLGLSLFSLDSFSIVAPSPFF